MALPPCPRCGGRMFPGVRRETSCVACGHVDYGHRILQPAEVERIAATAASRELRLSSTGSGRSLSRWAVQHWDTNSSDVL